MDKIDRIKNENDLNKELPTKDLIAKALSYLKKSDDWTKAIDRLKASTQNDDRKIETQDSTAEIEKLEDKQDEVLHFYYGIVHIINTRGSDVEFKYSKKLSNSSDVNERVLAADILGDLGYKDKDGNKYYEYAVLKLIELLDDEHEEVINSAAISLGKRVRSDDFRAIKRLVGLADHHSKDIRFSVAYALAGSEHKEAINTLIRLSDDEDLRVKDWAVFGLGTQIDLDTPEIRAVLKKHLDDEDFGVRGEALVGLAKRGDRSIVEAVKRELEGEIEGTFAIEASELLADPSLIDSLIQLKIKCDNGKNDYFMSCIEDAIKACSK